MTTTTVSGVEARQSTYEILDLVASLMVVASTTTDSGGATHKVVWAPAYTNISLTSPYYTCNILLLDFAH